MCDEALSNIRTVRAFAMEEKEVELYTKEVEKARVMQENLGMGIGLFQVISNYCCITLAQSLGIASLIILIQYFSN